MLSASSGNACFTTRRLCGVVSKVKSASERFHEEERALVVGMLRAGHQAGEIEVADADLAARAILRAYKTFTPPWCFMGEREDTWRLVGAVHGIVLSGIVRRSKGKRGT